MPHAGPVEPAANPLLQFDQSIAFDRIAPDNVSPAVELLLSQCRGAVERVTDPATPADWEPVVLALEHDTQRLSRAWAAVSHLNAVADSPPLRAKYNSNLPKLTQFWTELSQNLALYDKYRSIAGKPQFGQWNPARRRTVENELRDFRLGGAELPPEQRERLRSLRERESQIATRFAENVLDSTGAFSLVLDDAQQLAGIPEDVLEQYREAAGADGRTGYKLTLHAPSYLPALQYAQDRSLRERLYRAYTTRASEFGPAEWDNTPLMLELLTLRREHAQLLGYRNFAELMAQFYLDLYARDHKQGGAWQDDARGRWRHETSLQTPISFLTCNFSRPAEGRPALLTHDEVLTLLHEFGHGLHHMLTRVDEPPVAGIHGVEWDAVELPSQFMENFGWQWQALQMLTEHAETGAQLPRALFDRIVAARN